MSSKRSDFFWSLNELPRNVDVDTYVSQGRHVWRRKGCQSIVGCLRDSISSEQLRIEVERNLWDSIRASESESSKYAAREEKEIDSSELSRRENCSGSNIALLTFRLHRCEAQRGEPELP